MPKSRIIEEYDERRNEIIDTASRIFIQKGYEETSVNGIIKKLGIAKGTFYHYFNSKEELLDSVIEKFNSGIFRRAESIANDSSMASDDKLVSILLSMNIKPDLGEKLLEDLHKPNNALLHQKSLVSAVKGLTPVLLQVVEEGNRKGVFSCPYPREYIQIFLSSALTLFDDGIFDIEHDEKYELLKALISVLEKMLGVKEDSLQEKRKDVRF